MKSLIAIITLILTFMVFGCSNPIREQLESLDRTIEQSPDSVYKVLQSIDTTQLKNKRDRALYALLMTQAMVKNDVPVPSCSLINIAVNYYDGKDNNRNNLKALFYKGYVLRELGYIDSAVLYAVPALDLAQNFNDYYWIGKTAEQLTFLFEEDFDNKEVAAYSKKAAEAYLRAGKITNHRFVLCDYLHRMGHLESPEKYLSSLDSLRQKGNEDTLSSYLKPYILERMLGLAIISNKYSLVKAYFDSLISYSNIIGINNFDYIYMGEAALGKGDMKEAKNYIDALETVERSGREHCAFLDLKSRYYLHIKNYKEAYILTDSCTRFQNQLVENAIGQSVKTIGQTYYRGEAERKESQRRAVISYAIIGGVFFLFIFIAGSIIFYFRMRAKNSEIKSKILEILDITAENRLFRDEAQRKYDEVTKSNRAKIESLSHAIDERDEEIRELNKSFHSELNEKENSIEALYSEKWMGLNRLCRNAYALLDDEKLYKKAWKEVKNQIKEIGSKENLTTLEKEHNRYYNKVIERLRLQCHKLKEEDIELCILTFSRMSAKVISILLDISPNQYYGRRRRIKERIEKSGAPDKEEFIKRLNMSEEKL